MTIKGFILDFDGLIIDTEMVGCRSWAKVFNQYGFPFTIEDWKKAIGTGPSAYDPAQHLSELTHGLVDARSLAEKTWSLIRKINETEPMLPGVLEFLKASQKIGIPMAVASSSDHDWVEELLKKHDIRKYFSAVCTRDDVIKVKPEPELYLLAASKIGVHPSEAIAFEDSPSGLKAAKAAGILCIVIPNAITESMDLSLADRITSSFLELDPEQLLNTYK